MNLPPRIVRAIIVELKAALKRDEESHAAGVLAAAALDEFIRATAAARVDKSNLIEQLERLLEMDPHAAKTPLPPPPPHPPPPPGATPPRGLSPPPRKR